MSKFFDSLNVARTRRQIISGKPYELILRVSNKLPFVALELVDLIIKSALARAQRDNKVIICHHIWMGNHVHIILIPLDPQQCVNFYQELQKKLTDSFKGLMGLKTLSLWDGSPVLAELLDIDKVIEKIAYAYANPATANLVDSIEEYPGLSSYQQFLSSNNTLKACSEIIAPYIRMDAIKPLQRLILSSQEDREYSANLKDSARTQHKLIIHHNAWMSAFGISSDAEVAETNTRIFDAIKRREQEARDKRGVEKKTVVGSLRLKRISIFSECKSAQRGRRIFFHASTKELRLAFLAAFKDFTTQCRKCYELLKQGVLGEWPPGAFRPPAGPLASAIA